MRKTVPNTLMSRTQDFVRERMKSEPSERLRDVLVRRSLGTFGLTVAGTALSMATAVLLARILGTSGYGSYTYARTWIGVLGVFAPMGFEVLVLRTTAVHQAREQWRLMRGMLRRSSQLALVASLGIAIGASAFLQLSDVEAEMRVVIQIALLMLPIGALARIRVGAIQGLQHVLMAQIPGAIIQPALLGALVVAAYFALGGTLSASWAMAMTLLTSAITLLAVSAMLSNVFPESATASRPAYQTRAWLKSAIPLVFVNGAFVIMSATDTLMLGALKGPESVGAYAIAKRGALLITFVSGAVNTALAPTIANLDSSDDSERLQSVITKSMRLALLVAMPVGAVLILFGDWFLMMFGPEFVAGRDALTILSLGQIAQLGLGSVTLLLIMTGHERDAAIGAGVGAIINAGLNWLLVPTWGIEGAAVATALSMLLLGVWLVKRVHERLGIHPTVLGVV
jgi:O-antigen/teichoic acid export membrane protein